MKINVNGRLNIFECDGRIIALENALNTNSTLGNVTLQSLVVNDNITVYGPLSRLDTIQTNIKDNLVVLNAGETGNGVTLLQAGLEIDRGSETNTQMIWDESSLSFRVGTLGQTLRMGLTLDSLINDQPIITLNETLVNTTQVSVALVQSTSANVTNVSVNNANAQNTLIDNASVTNLVATNATVLNVIQFNVTANNTATTNLSVGNLTCSNLVSSSLTLNNSTVTNSTLPQLHILNAASQFGVVGTLSVANLAFTEADIVNLVVNDTLQVDNTLLFTTGQINTLSGNLNTIQNLVVNSLSSGSIPIVNTTLQNIYAVQVSNANHLVQNLSSPLATLQLTSNTLLFNDVNTLYNSSSNAIITNESITNCIVNDSTVAILSANHLTHTSLLLTNSTSLHSNISLLYATNTTLTNAVAISMQSLQISSNNNIYTNLCINNAIITNLVAPNATSTHTAVTNAILINTSIAQANITHLDSTNNTITNLYATLQSSQNSLVTLANSSIGHATYSLINTLSSNNTILVNATLNNAIVSNLTSNQLPTNTLNTSNLSSNNANLTFATIDTLYSTSLEQNNTTIVNSVNTNVSLSSTHVTNLSSNTLITNNAIVANATIGNVTAVSTVYTNLSATNVYLLNTTQTNLIVSQLTATDATIPNVYTLHSHLDGLLGGHMSANSITCTDVTLVSSIITNLSSSNAVATAMTSSHVNTSNLSVANYINTNQTVTNLAVNLVSVNNLIVSNLSAGNASIGNVTATTLSLYGTGGTELVFNNTFTAITSNNLARITNANALLYQTFTGRYGLMSSPFSNYFGTFKTNSVTTPSNLFSSVVNQTVQSFIDIDTNIINQTIATAFTPLQNKSLRFSGSLNIRNNASVSNLTVGFALLTAIGNASTSNVIATRDITLTLPTGASTFTNFFNITIGSMFGQDFATQSAANEALRNLPMYPSLYVNAGASSVAANAISFTVTSLQVSFDPALNNTIGTLITINNVTAPSFSSGNITISNPAFTNSVGTLITSSLPLLYLSTSALVNKSVTGTNATLSLFAIPPTGSSIELFSQLLTTTNTTLPINTTIGLSSFYLQWNVATTTGQTITITASNLNISSTLPSIAIASSALTDEANTLFATNVAFINLTSTNFIVTRSTLNNLSWSGSNGSDFILNSYPTTLNLGSATFANAVSQITGPTASMTRGIPFYSASTVPMFIVTTTGNSVLTQGTLVTSSLLRGNPAINISGFYALAPSSFNDADEVGLSLNITSLDNTVNQTLGILQIVGGSAGQATAGGFFNIAITTPNNSPLYFNLVGTRGSTTLASAMLLTVGNVQIGFSAPSLQVGAGTNGSLLWSTRGIFHLSSPILLGENAMTAANLVVNRFTSPPNGFSANSVTLGNTTNYYVQYAPSVNNPAFCLPAPSSVPDGFMFQLVYFNSFGGSATLSINGNGGTVVSGGGVNFGGTWNISIASAATFKGIYFVLWKDVGGTDYWVAHQSG